MDDTRILKTEKLQLIMAVLPPMQLFRLVERRIGNCKEYPRVIAYMAKVVAENKSSQRPFEGTHEVLECLWESKCIEGYRTTRLTNVAEVLSVIGVVTKPHRHWAGEKYKVPIVTEYKFQIYFLWLVHTLPDGVRLSYECKSATNPWCAEHQCTSSIISLWSAMSTRCL